MKTGYACKEKQLKNHVVMSCKMKWLNFRKTFEILKSFKFILTFIEFAKFI